MCRLAVVKLGGSVVTRKSEPETIDYENLASCSRAVREYLDRGGRLVLVLGGGSFGHYAVRKLLESKRGLDARDSSVVQLSMMKLALSVLLELHRSGVPAVAHPPHSICENADAESCDTAVIRRDLSLGLVPVVFGDAIPSGRGAEIISGDDIAAEIASSLRADCLIFVTSAPGVLARNGEVVRVVRSLDEIELFSTEGFDVTGGIARKVERALQASRMVENVRIVGVKDLGRALAGDDVGTRVVASGE
ncbi:MAG: isopentenyl phosphate kinase [Acidilobaceae archaeon]